MESPWQLTTSHMAFVVKGTCAHFMVTMVTLVASLHLRPVGCGGALGTCVRTPHFGWRPVKIQVYSELISVKISHAAKTTTMSL